MILNSGFRNRLLAPSVEFLPLRATVIVNLVNNVPKDFQRH
jgi:hypothetical protein